MNWNLMRLFPWIDTRTKAVRDVPRKGSVLDIGTNDGRTLMHVAQYRPDIRYSAIDLAAAPSRLPPGCQFWQVDVTRQKLPHETDSLDAVMALHVIEHLPEWDHLFDEINRVLKPGGRLYLEFPADKTLQLSSPVGAMKGLFTLNFHDDPTHIRFPSIGEVSEQLNRKGFSILQSGTSRNLLFAASFALFYHFRPESFRQCTAYAHWVGWSAYVCARKPQRHSTAE